MSFRLRKRFVYCFGNCWLLLILINSNDPSLWKIIFQIMQNGRCENPRIMYGVIITVYYVDRQTMTVRSFRAGRGNECTWNREIGRRANLLAYIRQLRAESDVVESKNKPERKVTFLWFSIICEGIYLWICLFTCAKIKQQAVASG